jgi:hypothetical protein
VGDAALFDRVLAALEPAAAEELAATALRAVAQNDVNLTMLDSLLRSRRWAPSAARAAGGSAKGKGEGKGKGKGEGKDRGEDEEKPNPLVTALLVAASKDAHRALRRLLEEPDINPAANDNHALQCAVHARKATAVRVLLGDARVAAALRAPLVPVGSDNFRSEGFDRA